MGGTNKLPRHRIKNVVKHKSAEGRQKFLRERHFHNRAQDDFINRTTEEQFSHLTRCCCFGSQQIGKLLSRVNSTVT